MDLSDKVVLITGGTGSFGRKFAEVLINEYHPKKLIIFSRDELKQFEMRNWLDHDSVRYFIGDVRDQGRLHRAFSDVDIVIHAAALKQVPTAEYNPFEAVKTNIIGAENIINAAIDCDVERVIALSTDKAVNPINLYGATKLCSDKLFIAGNAYSGGHKTRFSVVRYGNVIGSRGSVIPFFMQHKKNNGYLPITDPRMTRFWITLEEGVRFVVGCIDNMTGGEIFVPKSPSMKIVDLADIIAPDMEKKVVGIRPGEKIHEILITDSDATRTIEFDDYYLIKPEFALWGKFQLNGGDPVDEGFSYASDANADWMTRERMIEIIHDWKEEYE
ncbi:UDP-N-acetylglucosamine 4,6-dehydratase (inverting) [candidate division KSB1 bacterium]